MRRKSSLEEIYSDELVLAVYKGHPWEGRENVELNELAGMPFVMRERSSGTRMVMAQALEAAGFAPSLLNVVAEMGSTEASKGGDKGPDRNIHNLFVRGEGGRRKKQPLRGPSKKHLLFEGLFSRAKKKPGTLTPLFGFFGASSH